MTEAYIAERIAEKEAEARKWIEQSYGQIGDALVGKGLRFRRNLCRDMIAAMITTDRYTKIVLTVIAGALVWLSVQSLFRPQSVSAQQPTMIVDATGKKLTLINIPGNPNVVGIPVVMAK